MFARHGRPEPNPLGTHKKWYRLHVEALGSRVSTLPAEPWELHPSDVGAPASSPSPTPKRSRERDTLSGHTRGMEAKVTRLESSHERDSMSGEKKRRVPGIERGWKISLSGLFLC
eukprot:1392267-Amorphochlora_amoeboformis.AAC.2